MQAVGEGGVAAAGALGADGGGQVDGRDAERGAEFHHRLRPGRPDQSVEKLARLGGDRDVGIGEGVGGARDIDTGMVLGLNHPRGPLQWADTIGLDHVLTVLESLCEEYREERYRPAPALQRLVRAGNLGRSTGAGFFEYDAES